METERHATIGRLSEEYQKSAEAANSLYEDISNSFKEMAKYAEQLDMHKRKPIQEMIDYFKKNPYPDKEELEDKINDRDCKLKRINEIARELQALDALPPSIHIKYH